MAKSYWLVNSNRSRVKRFIENTNNKDKFFEYIFIDSGKVTSIWGKEPPVMTIREDDRKAKSCHPNGQIDWGYLLPMADSF